MLNSLKNTFLLALGALVLNTPSSGQSWIQPDYLWSGGFYSNPQCSNAPLTLPTFPGFKQGSLEIGWNDCQLGSQKVVTATWSAPMSPIGVSAQDMTAELSLTEVVVGDDLIAKGTMNLTYSRTWKEGFSQTLQFQVWRFLVNGDLRYSQGGKGSLRPSCASTQKGRVRYTGYVDWALNPITGTWSNAWMLTHAPDEFEHALSHKRGGNFHCDRSYSFVGPASGFIPNPSVPAENGNQSSNQARSFVRHVRRPRTGPPPFPPVPSAPYPASSFEEDVFFQVTSQYQKCPCGSTSTGFSQFSMAQMTIKGYFGSAAQSSSQMVNGFVSMGIGSWTAVGVYPGVEDVRWTIAEYEYFEPCTNESRTEIFHGVTTLGGYRAQAISYPAPSTGNYGVPLGKTFIDQSNALRKGRTSMNLPFKSDHILNLNS